MRKPARRDAELDESREIDEADIPLLSRIDGADPLDVLRRAEIRNKLEAALDALPLYHRGVIVMREVEGLSYEEMAEAMGVSKGTIMSRLFHARQKLQRALADCYAEEVRAQRPEASTVSVSRELLMRYHDGELSEAEARVVEAALEQEPALAGRARGLQRARQLRPGLGSRRTRASSPRSMSPTA